MIELGNGQVIGFPPLSSAVIGIPDATIIASDYRLRIGRINPDRVYVAMRALETTHRGEAFAAIFAHDHRPVSLEKAIWLFWVNDQVRKVKRTPNHPVTLIALRPGLPAVVGDIERAIGRLNETVNALCVRGCNRDRQPAIR